MSQLPACPECGEKNSLTTKLEAGYAKYWFVCSTTDSCGWQSKTFRGPRRDESEIDDIGYERHTAKVREDARHEAAQMAISDLG